MCVCVCVSVEGEEEARWCVNYSPFFSADDPVPPGLTIRYHVLPGPW